MVYRDIIMDAANSLAGIAEETSAGTEEISAAIQQQAATAIDHIAEQIKRLELEREIPNISSEEARARAYEPHLLREY